MKQKYKIGLGLFAVVSIFGLLLSAPPLVAKGDQHAGPEIVKVVGRLSVRMNDPKKVVVINIVDFADEIYHVVPDGKSKKMAKKHNGKIVKVTGHVDTAQTDKGNGMWLRLVKYKVITQPEDEID